MVELATTTTQRQIAGAGKWQCWMTDLEARWMHIGGVDSCGRWKTGLDENHRQHPRRLRRSRRRNSPEARIAAGIRDASNPAHYHDLSSSKDMT
jgi:hypothetical protein